MGVYIDANRLVKELLQKAESNENNAVWLEAVETARKYIDDNAVNVIRCKECKHYDSKNHQCWKWDSARVKILNDDYCSLATVKVTK